MTPSYIPNPAKVNVGYGYRLLAVGESIDMTTDTWLTGVSWIGFSAAHESHVGPHHLPIRRMIDVGEGYRLVGWDEKVERGDEFITYHFGRETSGVWHPIGSKAYSKDLSNPVRAFCGSCSDDECYRAGVAYRRRVNPVLPTTDLCILTTSVEDRSAVVDRLVKMGYSGAWGVNDYSQSQWPVVVAQVSSKTIASVSPHHSRATGVIPSSQFLSTYGQPKGAVPDQGTFYVNTKGNQTLAWMVCEAGRKAGFMGCEMDKDLTAYPFLAVAREGKTYMGQTSLRGGVPCGTSIYDAATHMGEIIKLIETPYAAPAPTPPTIHGYTGSYQRHGDVITFGCAQISLAMLSAIRTMGQPIHGNRHITGITLDSGKTISIAQIKETLDYVDRIDKGAS